MKIRHFMLMSNSHFIYKDYCIKSFDSRSSINMLRVHICYFWNPRVFFCHCKLGYKIIPRLFL